VIEPAADFERRVRDALAAPADGPLAEKLTASLVTAIVADAAEAERLEGALAAVADGLARVGVPRGRQFVLLGGADGLEPGRTRERAAALGPRVGLRAFAHDPAGACFAAGRFADGAPIELDDELREAEAVVVVGHGSAAGGVVRGGPYLLLPGLASAATRRAFAAARAAAGERAALALALAAEHAVPVDLAVTWDPSGRVTAAAGRSTFSALARSAGLA